MEGITLKNLQLRGDLTFFACLAVVSVLPVYINILPPFMVIWVIFWLIENKFRLERGIFYKQPAAILFLLFIVFFTWQVFGLFIADSIDSGLERIFKRLSFILLPLVLFYPNSKITSNIRLIIRIFAIATFLYCLYCLGNAFNLSLSFQDGKLLFNPHPADYDYENYFFSLRFSNPMHPSYLSVYVILSVFIGFETLFDKSIGLSKKIFWIILVITCLISVYLLSSRAGFIAILIMAPLYFLLKFKDRVISWILYITVSFLVAGFIIVAGTNERFSNDLEKISSDTLESAIQQDVRFTIWKSALSLFRQNPISGVGTGDASSELKKEFKSLGYENGYYDDLNAHNQFIEILLENGVIGLILFLSIIGYMIFIAWSDRNILYGLFIILTIIFFLFETVLNRQAGVTFFPLFAFLLIYYGGPQKT
jgi:O-antigen ligase